MSPQKPKQRYALTSDRKQSLLNSSIQLHNGRGITSYERQPRGKLAVWGINVAILSALGLVGWAVFLA